MLKWQSKDVAPLKLDCWAISPSFFPSFFQPFLLCKNFSGNLPNDPSSLPLLVFTGLSKGWLNFRVTNVLPFSAFADYPYALVAGTCNATLQWIIVGYFISSPSSDSFGLSFWSLWYAALNIPLLWQFSCYLEHQRTQWAGWSSLCRHVVLLHTADLRLPCFHYLSATVSCRTAPCPPFPKEKIRRQ